MEDNLILVSYLRSGRCWHILRVYSDDTFDIFYTSTQPIHDNTIPRQAYHFKDLGNVVLVGELKDWISGIIGIV